MTPSGGQKRLGHRAARDQMGDIAAPDRGPRRLDLVEAGGDENPHFQPHKAGERDADHPLFHRAGKLLAVLINEPPADHADGPLGDVPIEVFPRGKAAEDDVSSLLTVSN